MTRRRTRTSWKASVGVAFVVVCVVLRYSFLWEGKQVGVGPFDGGRTDCRYDHNSTTTATALLSGTRYVDGGKTSYSTSTSELNSIPPGTLPGYTGWGRPEWTLAKYFSIVDVVAATNSQDSDEVFKITILCQGHEACEQNDSLFFLRAYGPSVVPGKISRRRDDRQSSSSSSSGYYDATFVLPVAGTYTIEVVLTFSNPPNVKEFPLKTWSQSPYEGYILPGFPLIVSTTNQQRNTTRQSVSSGGGDEDNNSNNDNNKCQFQELIETSPTSAMEHNHWKVIGRSNGPQYDSPTITDPVTKAGYESGRNSIGMYMDYQHRHSSCAILQEDEFSKDLGPKHPFWTCRRKYDKIQIVYIGDSVLRVQKDMMRSFLPDGMSNSNNNNNFVDLNFLSLHEGYRKNQKLGPSNVQTFLEDIQRHNSNTTATAIIFNTGLHDIHRLCGSEFSAQRQEYIDTTILDSGSFKCVDEYRNILVDFTNAIRTSASSSSSGGQNNNRQLNVFQTTTAAWPKYGNYGIAWEHHQQSMPLVSDFAAAFNDIAFDVILSKEKKDNGDNHLNDDNISIMDGYWITYSRPDNREFGDIGKKLSHPGREVLSSMTRRWAMMILQQLCS